MKHTRHRKVGRKSHKRIIEEEISKIESQRPRRAKRNGKEVRPELQEPYQTDKDSLSVRKRDKSKNLIKGRYLTKNFNTPCIYLLYLNDNIVYVGQTLCLARRIQEHMESGKEFDSFCVHTYMEDEYIRLQMERILIRKHRPKYNKVHK